MNDKDTTKILDFARKTRQRICEKINELCKEEREQAEGEGIDTLQVTIISTQAVFDYLLAGINTTGLLPPHAAMTLLMTLHLGTEKLQERLKEQSNYDDAITQLNKVIKEDDTSPTIH